MRKQYNVLLAGLVLSLFSQFGFAQYVQTNLTSDLPGVAAVQDPNLVNPWGMAFSPTSPVWISDNGTGKATLYNGAGVAQSLVVTIPPTPSAPTGVVFNGTVDFAGSHFIFATENGTIAAWTSGTSAATEVTTNGAIYKGVALGNNGTANFLYATNFATAAINVFSAGFAPTNLAASFFDPSLPAGYAPFNIQNLGGKLYVTYAVRNATTGDDDAGAGNGIVDTYDFNGNFLQRVVSNGGALNSPWGLALAPANFGTFSNALLVGNFGDGKINAFNPTTGALLGTLSDASNTPIVNQGLWALAFANGGQGTATNSLLFTAGIPGPDDIEDHGLFGKIDVPEPGVLCFCGFVGLMLMRRNI